MSRTVMLWQRSSSQSPSPHNLNPQQHAQGVPSLATPTTRKQLWMAAIKPPMYTVAITPITVASAAAFADTATLHIPTLFLFLTAAVLIIAWLNITNDVFDYDTGIDANKPESLVNLLGASPKSRNALLLLANFLLILAFAALATVSNYPWDPTVLVVIAVAVFGGYAYQGPPFRLGYYGLGEPICFATWFLGVCAAYYSQIRHDVPSATVLRPLSTSQKLQFLFSRLFQNDASLLSASLMVAIPTAIILFCSHFHQIQEDQQAGKKSPIVRLGTTLAARVLSGLLVSLFVLELVLFASGLLQMYPFLLTLLSVPYALELEAFVSRTHTVPAVVRAAKYYAVKFHFIHGMLLTLGFLLSAGNRAASW